MSFWDLSDGSKATDDVSTDYKQTGFTLIPDGSNVLAELHSAKWAKAYESTEEFIEIEWKVEKPADFAGQLVRQKLWVTDLDRNEIDRNGRDKAMKKRDTHRKKLARIDAFGASRLMNSGKENFTDDDLAMALVGIRGVVYVMQWDINGNQGNSVVQINPLDTEIEIGKEKPKSSSGGGGFGGGGLDDFSSPSSASGSSGSTYGSSDLGDEIPF